MTVDVKLNEDKVIAISVEEHTRALARVIAELCEYDQKQEETIFDFLYNVCPKDAYDSIAEDLEDRLQEELEMRYGE